MGMLGRLTLEVTDTTDLLGSDAALLMLIAQATLLSLVVISGPALELMLKG